MALNQNKGWYFWHILGFRWCWFRYWDSAGRWYFPGGSVVKNLPAMQETQRCRLNPWVWKIPWGRKWQPTPVFSPGESYRQRSPVGVHGVGKRTERLTLSLFTFCKMSTSHSGDWWSERWSNSPRVTQLRKAGRVRCLCFKTCLIYPTLHPDLLGTIPSTLPLCPPCSTKWCFQQFSLCSYIRQQSHSSPLPPTSFPLGILFWKTLDSEF